MAVRVTSTSTLIAAVPALLGFVPEDSVIVLVSTNGTVKGAARISWDEIDGQLPDAVDRLAALDFPDMRASIVLAPSTPIASVDHLQDLLARLWAVFDSSPITVRTIVMTTGFTRGRWAELVTGEKGLVQDWRDFEGSAEVVHAGTVIHNSRQDVVDSIAVLAPADDGATMTASQAVQQISTALVAGRGVDNPAQLAAALGAHLDAGPLRDLLLGLVTIHPAAAADLFRSLAMHARGSTRAHLLTLLAAAAYASGSTARTLIAVEESRKSTADGNPTNMGELLVTAVGALCPPSKITATYRKSAETLFGMTIDRIAATAGSIPADMAKLLGLD